MGSIIYWADVLPKIGFFCTMTGILLEIFGVILLAVLEGENFKVPSYAWICGLVFLIAGLFIPSKEAIYGMYAINKIEEFVNNDEVIKQLPHKTIECLDKWLDEQLAKSNSAN